MGVHPAEWSPTLRRGVAMPGGPAESLTGGAHTRQTPVRHAHLRDPGRGRGEGGNTVITGQPTCRTKTRPGGRPIGTRVAKL